MRQASWMADEHRSSTAMTERAPNRMSPASGWLGPGQAAGALFGGDGLVAGVGDDVDVEELADFGAEDPSGLVGEAGLAPGNGGPGARPARESTC
ncbi:hypothetical protein [Pseudofrankia inefficax]|uniref:Uncharacterized protein n=1 Tax=Pseudofrankia inefficax (strain DSM 45817 / CECT 9037 / DDB 130130 / EuI1c) TaxID=298654 RepID=E3J8E2_PSEI1|nr:hypothetical protein FraEuI1c_6499 [Pseudofrankia inefficax]